MEGRRESPRDPDFFEKRERRRELARNSNDFRCKEPANLEEKKIKFLALFREFKVKGQDPEQVWQEHLRKIGHVQ